MIEKRNGVEKGIAPIEGHPIENCFEFEFKCPLLLEHLKRIPGSFLFILFSSSFIYLFGLFLNFQSSFK